MDILTGQVPSLLEGLLRKLFTNEEGNVAAPKVFLASAIPLVASAIWHYSRTVVYIMDNDQARWLQYWMTERHDAIRRVRRLVLVSAGSMVGSRNPQGYQHHSPGQDEREVGDRFSPPRLVETPAIGASTWTWFGWCPVSIETCTRGSVDHYGRPSAGFRYSMTVWFAPRGADVAKKIILEGRKIWVAKKSSKTEVLTLCTRYSPPFKVTTRPTRPLSSVIVEGNTKELLLADATRFLQGESWYIRKGIPYRRGWLLYGPPGCGKTSLITALAGELRLPIVFLTLSGGGLYDNSLLETVRAAPRDSIVLIEDIDCALANERKKQATAIRHNGNVYYREQDRSSNVTLSGLLNAIDGVAAQEGRLLFMTTNHRDQLDEALIRPGRVDMQCHLQNASRAAAGELFDQFFVFNNSEGTPSSGSSGDKTSGDMKKGLREARSAFLAEVEDGAHSFAQLQGALMKARDDPARAAAEMRNVIAAAAARKAQAAADVEESLKEEEEKKDESKAEAKGGEKSKIEELSYPGDY